MKWYINNIKGVGSILPLLLFFLYSDASIKHKTETISSSSSLAIEVYNSSKKLNIDILSITTKASCIVLFGGISVVGIIGPSSTMYIYNLYTINSSVSLKLYNTTSDFIYYYINK